MTTYSKFLIFTVPTYPYYLALGVIAAMFAAIYLYRGRMQSGRIVDVCLAGLACSVIGARIEYVLLNADYFMNHADEIARLSGGGLSWHGAVLGGIIGVVLMARLRKVMFLPLFDALAVGLPVLAFAGWSACGAAACAYGVEVDNLANYSSLLVAERADIYGLILPRYDTQQIGALIGLILFAVALIWTWRGWFVGYRFWLIFGLLSVSMFAIGFLRGDAAPKFGGLRLDQWLDLGFVVASAVAIFVTRYYLTTRAHLRLYDVRTHA